MYDTDTRINANTRRSAQVWTQGYDGETHYGDVFKALTPAFLILAATVAFMLALL